MAIFGKHKRGMTNANTAWAGDRSKPTKSKAKPKATASTKSGSVAKTAPKPAMKGETGSNGVPMRPKARPAAPMTSPRPKSPNAGSPGPKARRGSSKGKMEPVSIMGVKLPGLGQRRKQSGKGTARKADKRQRGKY